MQLGSHGGLIQLPTRRRGGSHGGSGLRGLIQLPIGSLQHGSLQHGSRTTDLDQGLLQLPRGLAANGHPCQ